MPNLLVLSTSCVDLEPRPLPSTGVTRLHRYYGPLRHPASPACPSRVSGWSHARPRDGASRVASVFLSHACRRQYPGGTPQCSLSLASPAMTAFPVLKPGRLPHHPFRGLLSVHSRYGLHRSPSPLQDPFHQRLQPLRYLHDCSGCYRPERKLPGGIRTRWKTAPLHGALQQTDQIVASHDLSLYLPES